MNRFSTISLFILAAAGCGDGGNSSRDAGDGPLGPKDPRACAPDDGGACPTPTALDTDDDVVGLSLGDGWTKARRLAQPIRSPGWEADPFPAADGTLWFAYSRADAFAALSATPPSVAVDSRAPVRCGEVGDSFAIWLAVPGCDGAWHVRPAPEPINAAPAESAAPALSGDGNFLYFATAGGSGAPRRRIVEAVSTDGVTFGTPVVLPFAAPAASADCVDDNPSPVPDGSGLLFESNRDDWAAATCTGPRRLWRATRGGSGWGPQPELFAQPKCAFSRPNIQPNIEIAARDLYFTVRTAEPACTLASTPGIWKVKLNGQPAPMGAAVRVLWTEAGGDLSVEEAAVDITGKRLFFTFGRADAADHLDLSLGVAEKP